MAIIDWATPLAAINGDNTSIAVAIRAKVTSIGGLYNRAGNPDVITESAAHIAWRADLAAQLAARDRTAASVDGLPTTVIDSANPVASISVIRQRLNAAYAPALPLVISDAVRALITDMLASRLPIEPQRYVDAYYAGLSSAFIPYQLIGDLEAALVGALAELSAYVTFR